MFGRKGEQVNQPNIMECCHLCAAYFLVDWKHNNLPLGRLDLHFLLQRYSIAKLTPKWYCCRFERSTIANWPPMIGHVHVNPFVVKPKASDMNKPYVNKGAKPSIYQVFPNKPNHYEFLNRQSLST